MRMTLFMDFGTIGLCAIVFFLLYLFIVKERKKHNTPKQTLLRTAIILTFLSFLLTGISVSIDLLKYDKNVKQQEEAARYSNQKKRELVQKITLFENKLKAIEEEKDSLIAHRDTLRITVRQSREDIVQIRELVKNLATHKVAKTSVSLPSDFSPQEAHVKVRFPKDEEIKHQLLEKIDIIGNRLNKVLD